jgi:ATP sulfurylase
MIVSENSCGHKNIERISGTKIREMIKNKITPPAKYMREEVFNAIIKLERIFI